MKKYKVTGVLPFDGRRRMKTRYPANRLLACSYNLWKGHVWEYDDEKKKWKIIKTYWN